jgi:hypothetical protein
MKNSFTNKVKMLFHGLFHGMKGADEVISQGASYGGGSTEIVQQKGSGGVMEDMLIGEETQQVKETRDAYYRILNEADKYSVTIEGDLSDDAVDSDKPLSTKTRKKSAADYLKHSNFYNPDNLKIRIIQEIKLIPKDSNFGGNFKLPEHEQTVSNIDIERDGFTPRFELERYANKIVVKTKSKKKVRLDFYTTIYASQFGKVDALFIAELNRIRDQKQYRSDTTSFKKVKFVSDKAFGSDDLCLFEYKNIVFKGIEVYDGNFILQFDADVVSDGTSITEKYHTKELDDKYLSNAPKKDAIDLFTLKRHIDKDENNDGLNLTKTTLKV